MDSKIVRDDRTLRVEARFKNARLYNAIVSRQVITSTNTRTIAVQRTGPIKSFCDLHGLLLTAVYDLLNLKARPVDKRSGEVRLICQRLANLLECDLIWLFPDELYQIKWPHYLACDVDVKQFVGLQGVRAEFLLPPSQQEDQEARELREHIDEALRTLTPREENILVHRFGLRGYDEMDQKTIAVKFNVSRERIRQIEAKALSKMRHPSRSNKLRDSFFS